MALRLPTRTSDRITLISYLDDAIDFDHPDIDQIIKEYISAETPDFLTIPTLDKVEPTKFEVRPLSEREIAIADDMAKHSVLIDGEDLATERSDAAANYQILRFGLCAVDNLDQWDGKKERLYSSTVWTLQSVELLDRHTVQFLSYVIRRWSTMQKKTNKRSTLSQGGTNGTSQTDEDQGRLTARSAKSTKGTQRFTAAGKKGNKARGNSGRIA